METVKKHKHLYALEQRNNILFKLNFTKTSMEAFYGNMNNIGNIYVYTYI